MKNLRGHFNRNSLVPTSCISVGKERKLSGFNHRDQEISLGIYKLQNKEESMLPKKYQGAKHSQSIARFSPRIVLAATILLSAFRLTCAVLLIGAVGTLGLHAKNAAHEMRLRLLPSYINPTHRVAEAPSPAVPPAKPPDNIEDETKTALANEWTQPDGVKHVLEALKLLTSSSPDPFKLNLEVLSELKLGGRNNEDLEDLYRAAMGVPDRDGRPTVQGLPNFLDILAKANTLKKKPADEDGLFASTQTIIDAIFGTGPGKLGLVKINDSFGRKENYVALFQLLDAYPKPNDECDQNCANDLEKLRAAFEMNTDRLAKQVAAKITASKE